MRDTEGIDMGEQTITLRGRVGTDLATHTTSRGQTWVRFRLAVSQWRIDDAGEFKETGTHWYTVKAWDRLADNALTTLRKGQKIIVIGRPVPEAWVDQATNEVRSALSISANTIGMDLTGGIYKRLVESDPWQGEEAAADTEPEEVRQGNAHLLEEDNSVADPGMGAADPLGSLPVDSNAEAGVAQGSTRGVFHDHYTPVPF